MIEFPKALYNMGAYMAVENAGEEAAARADGWTDWLSDRKRTNPEEFEGEQADAGGDEPKPMTRAEMMAQADARGLAYKGNISNAALAALIDTVPQA